MNKQLMNNKIKNSILFILLGGFAAVNVAAQNFSTAGMEQMKMQRLWAQTQNAAGMYFDDATMGFYSDDTNYSNLEVGYDWKKGDFQRPQEGAKETLFNVLSEGFVKLNEAYVWGAFSFTEKNMTDAGYNASITDPYRGMPYYVIDSHLSDWRNQYYDLKFRVGTPRWFYRRWTFGLEGAYAASIAAKQRDPRVDSRYYTLKFMPGVTFRLNKQHRLGLSLKYASMKEDSRMDREDSNTDHDYYIMYGLGVAVKGIGAGRTADYYGDRWGAALQYNYQTSLLNFLLEAAYDMKAETVTQNYLSTPKKDAAVKEQQAKLTATLYKKAEYYSHYLKGCYTYRHIDGIQFLSQRDNSELQNGWVELFRSVRSTYKTQYAEVDYALMKNRSDVEYNWKLNVTAAYMNQSDEYLLPRSIKQAENLFLTLAGKKNFALGSKLNRRFLLDLHATYKKNLGGEYLYGGTHADYITVTELETREQEYLMSDYWRFGLSMVYSQQIKANSKVNLFAKAAADFTTTSDYGYNNRTNLSFSVGCNF